MQELRCGKAAFCIYKSIYFIWATGWGYYVLKDTNFLPPCLGGKGEMINNFKGVPYDPHPPQLKEYLLITMGYHVGGFFTHFFNARKNDFLEMALHHIVAIYLFGGCYLYNVMNIGSTIAFLHDIADITTNIVKTLTETNYTKTTAVVFVTHMCIWFYTRNIILPYLIY